MKRLSKMAALGLALALTFGMSVNAAESVTTEGNAPVLSEEQTKQYEQKAEEQAAATTVTATVGGVSVTVTKTAVAPQTLAQAEQVGADKVIANASSLGISIPEGATVTTTVVGSANITIPEGIDISKGLQLSIGISGIQAGKNYVLLHLTKDGVWETIRPDSIADGKVTATFKSLSPVVASEIIVVGEDDGGHDEWPEPRHPENAAAAPAGAGTSPKTGETLPAAGLMALICLAGAAVCAKRVRYNR